MPRILHIVNKWQQGGVERFIERLVDGCCDTNISQSILSICTDVRSDIDCPKYGPMNDALGMASMFKGSLRLGAFLDEHSFDAVHIHTQNSSGFLYAHVAEKRGIEHRIIHSHNSSLGLDAGIAKKVAQRAFHAMYSGCATMRLACSTEAGDHLFPNKDFRVIPNGIDVGKFEFDGLAREEIRAKFGIAPDALVVGCVGSFVPVKNHRRCIAIFDGLRKKRPDSTLLLLGEGELEAEVREDVHRRGLEDGVVFVGYVGDSCRYYSAMDALLLPSFFEGLPISLVEAQCNGLAIACTDTITREVGLTDLIDFISLDASDGVWVDSLLAGRRDASSSSARQIEEKGFSGRDTISALLDIYRSFG